MKKQKSSIFIAYLIYQMATVISYNVNGIRAAMNKGFLAWLQWENPDIICLQETKIQRGQIDSSVFTSLGYYHYWHYAVKKGYSGVALLSKQKPDNVVYGMGISRYDNEGRFLRADFGNITICSLYIPSGSMGDERQEFKMQFLHDFYNFAYDLKKERPQLIISGDYNICHKAIDIHDPKEHEDVSGFLPEERAWMDDFTGMGFIDSFRLFDQSPKKYSWWSYRAGARAKNLGWRIDYHMVSEIMHSKLTGAAILSDVVHSDHCPVKLELVI